MRKSGRLFIVLGVGLALVAVALVAAVLLSGGGDDADTEQTGETGDEPREITVVVAARDVPAHTVIVQDDLREERVQSDEVSPDVARSTLDIIGQAYSLDLVAGQPVLTSNIELPGLSNAIDPGRRAFTLPVEGQNLVGGLLRQDDRIDVVFTMHLGLLAIFPTYPIELPGVLELREPQDENGNPATILPIYGEPPAGPTYPFPGEDGSRFLPSDVPDGEPTSNIILQNVRIMRVVSPSIEAGGGSSEGNYLILDVDPTQAEVLQFLAAYGQYQIILRSPDDQETVTTQGVTITELIENWDMLVPRPVVLPEGQ